MQIILMLMKRFLVFALLVYALDMPRECLVAT